MTLIKVHSLVEYITKILMTLFHQTYLIAHILILNVKLRTIKYLFFYGDVGQAPHFLSLGTTSVQSAKFRGRL